MCKDVPIGAHILLHIVGNGHHNASVARYGIVQLARIETGQAHIILFLLQVNKSSKQLNGIGAFLVNVVARVSARKSLNRNLQEEIVFGRLFFFKMEYGMRAAAACTRYENLPFVFRVEVDEPVACHKSGLHTRCARHLCFFVAGENAFQWPVFYVVAFEYGQLHGHANAVVGAKRRTLSLHPIAVYISLNGIRVKVELYVNQLVAHHIGMALQYNHLSVFVARCSGFTYNYVVHSINFYV